ncbi:acyl-[acyl-carrier-protein]-phospholipid O-acyltransferase/long-chain-fatty-acid--[acyl-carrier-protein] ligase [Ancylobacter aquaticus]|uniref:Acyl-[acyl-carrier-protein]-phospholipid O-acyltransferase/long-chain-fatty-acid--[acyl-carrier-protein] ligase n=1 Tax=Ancylobacter aquaticus TaxID=100 RepID=A0A4V2PK04_ANCAQ|nr:acyl-[ACP]--phospholipid O-acyltransferase [Ancylobacter aquaticus]TCK30506.1 acyl-[acyl-carrier-protein]-phospholipid O-acyltransferase/long-chain-fatty-acid--[acyl-carrier-protein] ligase [Ancylobacter aquaticus]
MFTRLMTARRFAPLFWCQFFAAFNDNFVKNAMALLILYGIAHTNGGALVTLAGGIFILPFFLFSSLGGQLADRYDKSLIARRVKFAEIWIVLIASAGFVIQSIPLLFVGLFFMGTLSALFGPVKYGILPDHLAKDELVSGNALIEMATFAAILGGTVGGALAFTHTGEWAVAGFTFVLAVIAWLSARGIPHTLPGAPDLVIDRNIWRSTMTLLADIRAEKPIWRGALIVSWFWLVGAVVLSLLPTLVKENVGGVESVVTLFLVLFTIGVAIGSTLAAKLSEGHILLALVPVAGLLMGVFAIDLALLMGSLTPTSAPIGWYEFLTSGPGVHAAIGLIGLAAAGGAFVVPTFAFVQAAAGEDRRARVIAGNNVLNAAFMVAGAVIVAGLQFAGFGAPALLGLIGAASLVVAILAGRAFQGQVLRDLIKLVFRVLFRVEVTGAEHLKAAGPGSVIAINHVSFLDAPLIMALLDNDPVFAVDRAIAEAWWVKPFLSLVRAFPLDPTKPMATRDLIRQVQQGEQLVIFPEGRITVTGSIMKIYDGSALIADKADAPVVPVRIEGLEQTYFSRLDGQQTRKRLFPKVRVTILPPRKLKVDRELLGRKRRRAAGAALYDVMSDLVFETSHTNVTVYQAVEDAAVRLGMGRIVLEDPLGTILSYRKLLLGAKILGDKLARETAPGEKVGVLLPNAAGIAVVLMGLSRHGRVPVMLNYTAGPANLVLACKAAEVKLVVASRAFIEKARLEAEVAELEKHVRVLMSEEIRASVTTTDKIRAMLPLPAPKPADPDEPAFVLFTSGSEGTPKGVVLSHRNILTNVAQVAARIDFSPADIMFNVLPVFHSFGLTGGLVLPMVSGLKTYLYPSPLHYRIIPELVYATNATAIVGTDTFLMGYARTANPYDFRSLRFVVAGAEPVKAETRRVWMEKFGHRILEGYGVTECAPVLAVNTPMFNRVGTVGRMLPGIHHRLETMPGIEEGGRLQVRGPNVMLGYLRAEAPGVIEPPEQGWYDTGDIVAFDEEGFVAIRGRVKRFAKIAGEMISLAAIDAMVAALRPDAEHVAVAVPDARRGERIILMTTAPDLTRAALQAHGRERGVSELMIPADILRMGDLPLLGSGKVDFTKARTLALEMLAARATVGDGA